MEIHLRDVPETLFDKDLWQQFCNRFESKESALSAISRITCGNYNFSYHGPHENDVPAPPEQREEYAEATRQIGDELILWLKHSLMSGVLRSTAIDSFFFHASGYDERIDIPGHEWERLWPNFIENQAHGSLTQYERVRIVWDARKNQKAKALEQALIAWLRQHSTGTLPKKQLRKMANDRFCELSVRTFDRAYSRVFKRKIGRPPSPK